MTKILIRAVLFLGGGLAVVAGLAGAVSWQPTGPMILRLFGSGLGFSSHLFWLIGKMVCAHFMVFACPSKKMKFALPPGPGYFMWVKRPGQIAQVHCAWMSASVHVLSPMMSVSAGRVTAAIESGGISG